MEGREERKVLRAPLQAEEAHESACSEGQGGPLLSPSPSTGHGGNFECNLKMKIEIKHDP